MKMIVNSDCKKEKNEKMQREKIISNLTLFCLKFQGDFLRFPRSLCWFPPRCIHFLPLSPSENRLLPQVQSFCFSFCNSIHKFWIIYVLHFVIFFPMVDWLGVNSIKVSAFKAYLLVNTNYKWILSKSA